MSTASHAMKELWYNSYRYDELAIRASGYIKAELTPEFAKALSRRSGTKMKQVKMLLYDWTLDPALHDIPELQKKVAEAQVAALKKLRKNPERDREIVREFLKRSGLQEHFFGLVADNI